MSSDEDTPSPRVVIGISFGNSYSSIAYTAAGDAKVIANEEGDRQIPSILSYVGGEEFHGTQAKLQLVRNPVNTAVCFRDFLGKNYDSIDPTPCHNAAHPEALESTIAFSIKDTNEDIASKLSVLELTTRHLRRLKNSASDYLGKSVNAAVITVPTDFSDGQKAALVKGAENAGLEVLQIIPEPVAALLAQDRRTSTNNKPHDKVVLVADLGGTRSDIAVISTKGGMYSILATAHDYNLGGNKLDAVLIEHFAKEFQKKHKQIKDPRSNQRSLAKLALESEACKKALSLGTSSGFNVESLDAGVDFSSTVNRSRYELLAGKVFASFTRLIEGAVQKAGLDILDVDEILLCGGTAHTPRIAQNIVSHFPESTVVVAPSTDPNATNPSELAARGAALQAYLIESFDKEDIEQSAHPMVTVTPHLKNTVGLLLKGEDEGSNKFYPIISAETPLPVRRTINFLQTTDIQSGAVIGICEGVREIKITKQEAKSPGNGSKASNGDVSEADDEDGEDSDDEDDEEEIREKTWKIGTKLAELALKEAKKGTKLTLQINISTDLEVVVSAMEIGKGRLGVRRVVPGFVSQEANGTAR